MTREPLNLEALRRREVQMMGAAISTRSWHDMENAYNQLRDKIDAELTRLHLATKDAADPQSRGQAFDGEGEARSALEYYRDQMCEGFCEGFDPRICKAVMEENPTGGDCAGCRAVIALTALSSSKRGEG